MTYHYVWLVWSSAFLLPWVLLYALFPQHRVAMWWASVFMAPFGLTEPMFVPEYWNPPSLFELAQRTGFDIESIIFSFAIGGIGAVLYNIILHKRMEVLSPAERHQWRHRWHRWALATPFALFPILYMNTSRGNAVSPASHRRAFAIAARKLVFAGAALVVLGLTFGVARAAGVNPDQPIRLDGMELFFGIVPAEILRGHPREHEEQTMHGGVPRGKGVHHLIISVFDAKTRARIADAMVTGSVTELGMATQTHKLEAMSFGGAVSYGNYYAMPNQDPYEIVVNVRRPGDSKTVTARFQYGHPRK